MQGIPTQELLDAGVHFGHLKKKWNPKMQPYIFVERKGIHIIDLNKTNEALVQAAQTMRNIARSGRKILFVATKKQAKDIVADAAKSVGMPYATERWLGGMLTNFATIRRSIKKMQTIDKTLNDGAKGLVKKERLMLEREGRKLERVLGGIANMNRLPSALFLVDIVHEHIALKEAKKLGIQTIAMVDTNCDPTKVDAPIPANDDASKSVALIVNYLTEAIKEGLKEREQDKLANASSGGDQGGDGENDAPRRKRASGTRRRRQGGENTNNNNESTPEQSAPAPEVTEAPKEESKNEE